MHPIYLDYAATTPVDPRVAVRMNECLLQDGHFGNPASLHDYGRAARDVVEEARAQVAAYLKADPQEIIWTSGATESNNLALKGAVKLYQRKGKHIVTVKTEHKAVLDPCQHLEKEGYQVTYLTPQQNGLLDLNELEAALRDDTILVSVMHINNETGVVQDIAKIAELTSSRGILLHTDAAQTPGKAAFDVSSIPVDLLSLSAHKAYGPKGVGALYLRRKPRVRVEPLLHGGGHEQGMRSGTLPTHQLAGMGEALYLAYTEMAEEYKRISALRDELLTGLNKISAIHLNVPTENTVPHIINFRCEGMLAEAVLAKLPMIAASTGSACLGKGTEGSYVLRALGLTTEQAKSTVRFSLGRFTTSEQIAVVVEEMGRVLGAIE